MPQQIVFGCEQHITEYSGVHGRADSFTINLSRFHTRRLDRTHSLPMVPTGDGVLVELRLASGEPFFTQEVYSHGRWLARPFFERRIDHALEQAKRLAASLAMYEVRPEACSYLSEPLAAAVPPADTSC